MRLTENIETLGEKPAHCHCVCPKSHMTRPGIELGPPPLERPVANCLRHGAAIGT